MPLMFVNIETGEKRVYLHYLLTNLIKKGHVPAFVNYDIACRSTPYLRNFEEELKKEILLVDPTHTFEEGHTIVAGMKFAIGRWHAYGHQSKCHSLWNMLFQKGFGLSDGEDMERLWALLNQFAGATSQMNLGNHNDNLSLALLHILETKCADLPTKLVTVILVRTHARTHCTHTFMCTRSCMCAHSGMCTYFGIEVFVHACVHIVVLTHTCMCTPSCMRTWDLVVKRCTHSCMCTLSCVRWQDFLRAEGAHKRSTATLEGLERTVNVMLTSQGSTAIRWERRDTIKFLEEKGPTGAGCTIPLEPGLEKKKDPLRKYVLACVTAHTFAGKPAEVTMKDLNVLYKEVLKLKHGSSIRAPHHLLKNSEDAGWAEAYASLSELYHVYARTHLSHVGVQLLDALASVRHYEGCREHLKKEAGALKSKGVPLHPDNR